jgi:hypothetical protein
MAHLLRTTRPRKQTYKNAPFLITNLVHHKGSYGHLAEGDMVDRVEQYRNLICQMLAESAAIFANSLSRGVGMWSFLHICQIVPSLIS